MDGVLKSWAVPKGPSTDPKNKRLSVQVEDHPLEYGDFEGIIPRGEYGGGTVMLWDKGTWEEINELNKGYKQGNLTFRLHGKKLKGIWKLIKIKGTKQNWLLIKAKDNYAFVEDNILDRKPLSVLSNKTMNEIATNSKIWVATKKKAKHKPLLPTLNLEHTKFPQTITPALATLVDTPPVGANWLHEIKYDGYRIISFISDKCILKTRNQHDWSNKFPTIVSALQQLKLPDSILDGEVVCLDSRGISNFQLLQNAVKYGPGDNPLVYYVFDILYYDGYDITSCSIIERKKILKKILINAT